MHQKGWKPLVLRFLEQAFCSTSLFFSTRVWLQIKATGIYTVNRFISSIRIRASYSAILHVVLIRTDASLHVLFTNRKWIFKLCNAAEGKSLRINSDRNNLKGKENFFTSDTDDEMKW